MFCTDELKCDIDNTAEEVVWIGPMTMTFRYFPWYRYTRHEADVAMFNGLKYLEEWSRKQVVKYIVLLKWKDIELSYEPRKSFIDLHLLAPMIVYLQLNEHLLQTICKVKNSLLSYHFVCAAGNACSKELIFNVSSSMKKDRNKIISLMNF